MAGAFKPTITATVDSLVAQLPADGSIFAPGRHRVIGNETSEQAPALPGSNAPISRSTVAEMATGACTVPAASTGTTESTPNVMIHRQHGDAAVPSRSVPPVRTVLSRVQQSTQPSTSATLASQTPIPARASPAQVVHHDTVNQEAIIPGLSLTGKPPHRQTTLATLDSQSYSASQQPLFPYHHVNHAVLQPIIPELSPYHAMGAVAGGANLQSLQPQHGHPAPTWPPSTDDVAASGVLSATQSHAAQVWDPRYAANVPMMPASYSIPGTYGDQLHQAHLQQQIQAYNNYLWLQAGGASVSASAMPRAGNTAPSSHFAASHRQHAAGFQNPAAHSSTVVSPYFQLHRHPAFGQFPVTVGTGGPPPDWPAATAAEITPLTVPATHDLLLTKPPAPAAAVASQMLPYPATAVAEPSGAANGLPSTRPAVEQVTHSFTSNSRRLIAPGAPSHAVYPAGPVIWPSASSTHPPNRTAYPHGHTIAQHAMTGWEYPTQGLQPTGSGLGSYPALAPGQNATLHSQYPAHTMTDLHEAVQASGVTLAGVSEPTGFSVPKQPGGATHSTDSLTATTSSASSALSSAAADVVPTSIPTDERQCPLCGREFKYRSNLIRHIRNIHQRRKDFACDLCTPPRAFATADSLRSHTRAIHELRRDFVCEFCSRAFSRKAHLRDHVAFRHKRCRGSARRGQGRGDGRARAVNEEAACLEGADGLPQAAEGHPVAATRRQPHRAAATAVRYAELHGDESEEDVPDPHPAGLPAVSSPERRPTEE